MMCVQVEVLRLRHRALVYAIVYALLLVQTSLTVVYSTSSRPTVSLVTSKQQNLDLLVTTQATLVDINGDENLFEDFDDKFVDAQDDFDGIENNDDDDDDDDDEVIFHDGKDEFDGTPTDGATDQDDSHNTPNGGLLARLRDATKSFVAPTWEYYDLIVRFRKWRNEYNRLQALCGEGPGGELKLANALDVMRFEYAQVDKMLVDEMCHGGSENAEGEEKAKEEGRDNFAQYDMDFIWKVLKLLIGRLEVKLDELKRDGPNNLKFSIDYNDEETRETLKQIEANASDRAKRIIARSASHLAKREFIRLTQLLLSDMLATYVSNSSKKDASGMTTLMGHIEPFVFLIGTANSPLLISYVRTVKYRSVLNVAKSFYSALSCPRPQASESTPRAHSNTEPVV